MTEHESVKSCTNLSKKARAMGYSYVWPGFKPSISPPVLWTKPAAFESQHGMTFCPCTVLDALSFVAYNATQLEKKNKHSHYHGCRHVSDDIGDIKY